MKIDRSNYETWFIDWLDGNLNSSQKSELNNFIALNPDLREEFNEMTSISLPDPEKRYPFKEELKRKAEEISESQFEYLCTAYHENDLSESQRFEIIELIEKFPEKNRIFSLIKKTRLSPPDIKYKYKRQLLKSTPVHKVIRYTVIGLSTAAVVTIIIATYLSVPENLLNKYYNEAQVNISDTTIQQPVRKSVSKSIPPEGNLKNKTVQIRERHPLENESYQTPVLEADLVTMNLDNSLAEINKINAGVEKVPVLAFSGFSVNKRSFILASSSIVIKGPEPDDGRSNIGKYLAKTFRAKILKEESPPDAPLKGYEIAEAGVTGLNKIFGWEMALDKRNDNSGELKSVYFSSRMLKFNAPVKKKEPLP